MGLDIRVIYGDTDQMGVVYYGNYLRYFEASRGNFLRERGRSYSEFAGLGILLPIVEAHVRYRSPARYDELIHVEPVITQVRSASLRFEYRVTRGQDLLAEGWTMHACVSSKDLKPVRLPEEVRRLIGG